MGWYFIPDAAVPEGSVALVEGDEARHMAQVARIAPGEKVTLFDGGGNVLECEVVEVSPRSVRARVTSQATETQPRGPALDVAIGVIPLDRLKDALRGTVAAGIRRFVPLVCERSQAGKKRVRDACGLVEALQKSALAACKQAECPFLPEVSTPLTVKEVLREASQPGVGVLMATSLHPAGPPSEALSVVEGIKSLDRLLLLVGPEGGFTGAEYDLAASAGARFVRFAPYIYRTELAACALAVSVRAFVGW